MGVALGSWGRAWPVEAEEELEAWAAEAVEAGRAEGVGAVVVPGAMEENGRNGEGPPKCRGSAWGCGGAPLGPAPPSPDRTPRRMLLKSGTAWPSGTVIVPIIN